MAKDSCGFSSQHFSIESGPRAAKGEEGEELFVVRRRIKGPLWWADAFCADRQGRYLSTHDDNTFGVGRELRRSWSRSHFTLCGQKLNLRKKPFLHQENPDVGQQLI